MSHQYYLDFQEAKSWKFENFGFWRSTPYLVLKEQVKYPSENVILEKFHVIEDHRIECYQNWNKGFEKNEIAKLLDGNMFSVTGIYSNVVGQSYSQSQNLCYLSNRW